MNAPHRDAGFFTESLADRDPEIFGAITKELGRQRDEIELIASENIVSRAVMDAQGSVMTNKYAEGYPGRRYYGGCQFVDVAEDLGSIVSVKGMVEKPAPDTAPSNLAVIGRYILNPSILSNLNQIKSGAGGEIQLTDAIARDIGTENQVFGYRFRGQRFDCGSKAGFLQATVAFALARDDLRDDLMEFLRGMIEIDKAAQ